MKVEIFRLTGEPVMIEMEKPGTIRDVFSHPKSGKVINQDGCLLDAAEDAYGGIEGLGTLRINGSGATLETSVPDGATILLIPKVEGGLSA